FNFHLPAPPFFNQDHSLIEFRTSNTCFFQSRTSLDAILTRLHPHFSIKNHPCCNFVPLSPSFFNQDHSLMQFQPSRTLVFQSRTGLDAILTRLHPPFSIKNHPLSNLVPLPPSFFSQRHPALQFQPSRTLFFPSRTALDAIFTLPPPLFSLKNLP